MADVFVSYSREDRARADQIAQALQRQGVDVFWDSEIPPGQTWADYIEEKLSNCKVVLVLWSQHSTKSQWVREEARIGRDKGKLIPLMVDSTPAPFGFGEVQAADLSNWTGDDADPSWKRVLAAVTSAAARPGGAPSAAPASSTPRAAMSPPPQSGFRPASQTQTSAPAPEAKKGVNPIWWMAGGGVAVLAILAVIGANMEDNPAPPAPNPQIDQPINTPAPQQPGQQVDYRAQIMAQMATMQQMLAGQGFQPVGQPTIGQLARGGEQDIPVDLYVGYEYRIAAVCDNDCTDIDLTLFDGMGQVISQDNAVDNHPIVPVFVTGSGRFTVRVLMFNCTVEPCFYSAGLYGRPAQ